MSIMTSFGCPPIMPKSSFLYRQERETYTMTGLGEMERQRQSRSFHKFDE